MRALSSPFLWSSFTYLSAFPLGILLAMTMQKESTTAFSVVFMSSTFSGFTATVSMQGLASTFAIESFLLSLIVLMSMVFICESFGISLLKNKVPLKSPMLTFLNPECVIGISIRISTIAAAAVIPALRSHDTLMHIVFSSSSNGSLIL